MRRLLDTLTFALDRLRAHRILAIWVLLGLSVATTLALSLPLYVDSVYSGLLESRLDAPPYGFRFRYLGAWNGNIGATDVENASVAIQQGFTSTIGLPTDQNARYVSGGNWRVTSVDHGNLGSLVVGALEGAEAKITIVDGQWPPDAEAMAEDVRPVLIPQAMWETMGLQVGDQLNVQPPGAPPLMLEIAAFWRPTDENDPAWIFPPKFFDNILLVTPDDLWQALDGIDTPISEVAWYLVFDGGEVRTSDINGLISNITSGQRALENILPGIRQDVSPVEGLQAFNAEVNQLTGQLFIIVLPVGGLILYFVSMVSGLLVSRQQTEDVKLRSRGMSRRAVLMIHVLMWLLLIASAFGIGILASPPVVQLVGQTVSFLQFGGASSVQGVTITPTALLIGFLTGVIAASSGLLLAWRTTRQNINSYRQALVTAKQSWWQRSYLDLLLLIPAAYVLYSLQQQGGLATGAENPFSDPLAFLGPTLFALGVALLFLRLWPVALGIGTKILDYSSDISLLMALRELTRSIGRYRGTLLMMAFTLSLTGFTASMANTIDRSLVDAINYQMGADLVLVTASDAETDTADDGSLIVVGYNVPPVQELMGIDGVYNAARVGDYPAQLVVGSQRATGTVMGVDRGAMAAVTRFRDDFADAHVADLFNELAGNRTGIILSRNMIDEFNLALGQTVTLQVQALGAWYEARVPVIGYTDFFPTLDPRDGFFAITNIDPIFELVGTNLPHDVWLGLYPGADLDAIKQQVAALNFPVLQWLDPAQALQIAQAEPARRGVLGFLSVGFVAAITLTLIAAVIQNVSSFRAQTIQLGALRAMGLGGFGTGLYMMLLQGIGTVSGIASGTLIGVLTTLLFLPLLDFSGGLPPYLVRVAWDELLVVYAVFAGVLLFVSTVITTALSREQLSTVVKLGE